VTDLEVRPYRPGDEAAFGAWFARAFGRAAPTGLWAWKYGANPVGVTALLALDGGARLVAHLGGTPVWARLRGRRVSVVQATDWGVDPDYRRGLRGGRLLAQLADRFLDTFCGPHSGHALFWGVPIRAALAVLARRPRVETVQSAQAWLREVPPAPPPRDWRWRIQVLALDDAALDALWARLAPQYAFATIRDRAYFAWRYARCPFVRYHGVAVADRWRGRIEAVAVLRAEWEGQPYAVVVDWLAPRDRPAVGRLLLAACEARARALGREHLLGWFPAGSPEAALLAAAGYAAHAVPYTMVVARNDPALTLDELRTAWYYTAGDTDVF
jgi:hypothetical protein